MHAVYAKQLHKKPICFIADHIDVFSLLLLVAQHFQNTVLFCQDKNSDIDGITYHSINTVSEYIEAKICKILPCFRALTGSDHTNLFFWKNQSTVF